MLNGEKDKPNYQNLPTVHLDKGTAFNRLVKMQIGKPNMQLYQLAILLGTVLKILGPRK